MRVRVSTRGRITLPKALRRRLGIGVGDVLSADNEVGRIVLTPSLRRPYRTRIATDPITGLPVLNSGPGAPVLTSRQVREILACDVL